MDKITMIGVSGSGKTCFIYAMYNFMSIPHNGFSFTAANMDDDLDLQDGWDLIAYEHTWPDGSTSTRDYNFYVQYNTKPIMQFSWSDYRGGATSERSTNQDKQDLMNRIHEASCLIVSIGADTIKGIMTGEELRKTREISILNGIIHQYEVTNQRRVPIIFALTKADLYTRDDQSKLVEFFKTYFQTCFLPNSGWLTALVPVTLGAFPSGNGRGKIEGTIEPKNIQIPVMFFVASVLREKAADINNRLQNVRADRNRYRVAAENAKNQGWWSKFWNGDRAAAANASISSLNDEEKNLLNSMSDVEQTLGSMESMFRVCKIFYEGKEITY